MDGLNKLLNIDKMNIGLKYFSNISRYSRIQTHSDPLKENLEIIKKIISKIKKKNIYSVCDIGCGAGENLAFVGKYLEQNKPTCVGIEPSRRSVTSLKKKFKNTKLSFKQDSIHNLNIENDKFDLVICWSVLHWIDRELYLQSIGELIRIANKYIIVMDFCPKETFKNNYKHKKGIYTYKTDFDIHFSGSGIIEKKFESYFYYDSKTKKNIYLKNLKNIGKKSNINYHLRKICLYKKNYNKIKIRKFE